MMTFSQSVITCLRKYASFKGRASRSEFWWFMIFIRLAGLLSAQLALLLFPITDHAGATLYLWNLYDTQLILVEQPNLQGFRIISYFAMAATFLPALAVGARRLHDIGLSGWWQLLLLTGVFLSDWWHAQYVIIIGYAPLIILWLLKSNSKGDRFND